MEEHTNITMEDLEFVYVLRRPHGDDGARLGIKVQYDRPSSSLIVIDIVHGQLADLKNRRITTACNQANIPANDVLRQKVLQKNDIILNINGSTKEEDITKALRESPELHILLCRRPTEVLEDEVRVRTQDSATMDEQQLSGDWFRAIGCYNCLDEPERGYMNLVSGDLYFVLAETISAGGDKNHHWYYVYAHNKSKTEYGWIPWCNLLRRIDYGRAEQWQ